MKKLALASYLRPLFKRPAVPARTPSLNYNDIFRSSLKSMCPDTRWVDHGPRVFDCFAIRRF